MQDLPRWRQPHVESSARAEYSKCNRWLVKPAKLEREQHSVSAGGADSVSKHARSAGHLPTSPDKPHNRGSQCQDQHSAGQRRRGSQDNSPL